MVADRHRLAAYHDKHCWRAFRGYQHRWPWTTLNLKNRGFSEFFATFDCGAHLESEFSLKLLEIDQDNLRTKLNRCCRASHEH